jgi:hypothetical protein
MDGSPVDSRDTKEALWPLGNASEPDGAARLCLTIAGATDAEPASVSADLRPRFEVGASHLRVNRSLHRNDQAGDIISLVPRLMGTGGA